MQTSLIVHRSPSSHIAPFASVAVSVHDVLVVIGVWRRSSQDPDPSHRRRTGVITSVPIVHEVVPSGAQEMSDRSSPHIVVFDMLQAVVRSAPQVPPAHILPMTCVPVHESTPSARHGRPVMGDPHIIPSRLSRMHARESGIVVEMHPPVPLHAKVVRVRDCVPARVQASAKPPQGPNAGVRVVPQVVMAAALQPRLSVESVPRHAPSAAHAKVVTVRD